MLPHPLSSLPFVERFCTHPVLASTNDTARSMTEFPLSGIFVIQADCQTKGRGRSGASYFSDNYGGLWVSIITPVVSIGQHFVHNRALSLALCDTIDSVCGMEKACSIKWPNDIYWNTKKICGILLENHPANPAMLVLGFGVNISIRSEDFPESLRPIATSVLIETGRRYSRSLFLRTIIEYYQFNCATDPDILHKRYSQRLYGTGREVEIDGRRGMYDGVETDGRLRLKTGQEVIYVLSGHLGFISTREHQL